MLKTHSQELRVRQRRRPLDRRVYRASLQRRRGEFLAKTICGDANHEFEYARHSTRARPQAHKTRHCKRKVRFSDQRVGTDLRSAKRALSHPSAQMRYEAWRLLRHLIDEDQRTDVCDDSKPCPSTAARFVLKKASRASQDSDALVRRTVCKTLRHALAITLGEDGEATLKNIQEQESEGLVRSLASCLLDDELDVRLAATITLPCFGSDIADAVRKLLSSNAVNEASLVSVLMVLGRLGSSGACFREIVSSFLGSSYSEQVRVVAVRTLGVFCHTDVTYTLTEVLSADASPFVRLAAVDALASSGNCCCPKGHRLKTIITAEEYTCDRCESTVDEGTEMLDCRACDFDLCMQCARSEVQQVAVESIKSAVMKDSDWEVRRAALRALPRLGAGHVVTTCLSDDDADVRYAAVETLWKLAVDGDEDKYAKDVAALLGGVVGDDGRIQVDGTRDADARVRSIAAFALGKMIARSYDKLLEATLNDDCAEVRKAAVWSLGRLSFVTPDEDLQVRAPMLLSLAERDSEPTVRKAVLEALDLFGEPGQLFAKQVASFLTLDPDDTVRSAAADTLADMGSAVVPHIDDLCKALVDPCRYVRLNVAKALGKAASIGEAPSHAVSVASALARSVAKDRSFGVCVACIESLVAWGDAGQEHAHVLASILDRTCCDVDSVDEFMRKAAADALGSMGELGARHCRALANAMRQDSSATVRYCAAWALGEFGELAAEVAPDIVLALEDADADVREASARALGSLGETSACFVENVARCLNDSAADVRAAAARSIQSMGIAAAQCAAQLSSLVGSDDSATVRAASAAALGRVGESALNHLSVLSSALSDEEVEVRTAAVVALGELASCAETAALEIADVLCRALSDSDSNVRLFALESLSSCALVAQKPHMDSVFAVHVDSCSEVRAAVARTVSALLSPRTSQLSRADIQIDVSRGRETLSLLMDDLDEEVRVAAIRAVGSLGSEGIELTPRLRAIYVDNVEVEDIRDAVVEALSELGRPLDFSKELERNEGC
eukprot:TRINITY_DN57214_c0_g1_i1.p1 TRINITY_DN57214_c0_g1~~TRINITY_DN57214_c0_g1_i1.p1  ORF type:complete len:1020 (+),score=122.77 TRINITY_DN57214_c0_g1_i1:70-3129(+)